ncbi:hypothetical protein NQ317_012843 [Molorchus minor]|uniref:Uncharacterized protein n=1 Tax=Molorchus minor TaxID=1323400 RepID=A0ABQ9IU83_9CUCU|nr:hypothetical protein NQ317_012843 [Molorchus minor]
MESDLLIKEDEFHKENKKLEERTKELMKKKIQDNLIRETLNTKTDLDNIRAKKLNSDEVDLSNIAESTRGHDTNDEDLNTADAMGRKGAGHFYRAKIKRLQIENIRIQTENKNKTDEIIKLQKEKQALSEDKENGLLLITLQRIL